MNHKFAFFFLFAIVSINTVGQNIIPENFQKFQQEAGVYLLPNKKNNDFKTTSFKQIEELLVGQTVSLQLEIKNTDNSETEPRSCNGGAGFRIGDVQFLIENTKKDLRIYVGKGAFTDLPYYVLDRFSSNTALHLAIHKTATQLEWTVQTPLHTVGEKITTNTSKQALNLAFRPTSGKELHYLISDLNISEKPSLQYKKAELHPFYKYADSSSDKRDFDDPAAKSLVLDTSTPNLTAEELHGLESYLLNFKLPKHNHLNYYFRKRFNSYAMEWVFEQTKNIELLNKAIDFGQRAIAYRNDNFGQYKISFDRSIAPVWPNFKEVEVYEDGSVGLVPGASVFAGLAPITVPARMIANHPELWDKTYKSRTYKQIALEYIDEALKTTNYVYDVFVGEDNLISYPTTLMRTEWHDKLFIYNRVFPVITGAIPLVDALDIFETHSAKKNEINAVNQAMVNRLKEDIVFYEVNGKECMKYPYSEAMITNKPGKYEDFTHGAFDSRDFQLLYLSERYGWDTRYVQAMANTLVEVMSHDDHKFSSYMDGKGKVKKFSSLIAYNGYIWYRDYRPEIQEIIVDHVLENDIVYKNNRFDSYFIFEVLKLKSKH